MKILKHFLFNTCLLFALLFFFSPSQILASDTLYFYDEFNGFSLDTLKWQAYPNAGTISVNNGFVSLSSGRTSTFPYVYSKSNPFPVNGDFSLQFALQYTNVSYWGTGFVIGTKTPVNGQDASGDLLSLWVWQDSTTGNQGFRLNFGPQKQIIYSQLTPNYAYHTIKLDYINSVYKVFLDNNLIYTSSSLNIRPNVIWFGNPVNTHSIPSWNWTSFKLDYAQVTALEPPKTPLIIVPGIGSSFNQGVFTEKGDSGWNWTPTTNGSWRQFLDSLQKAGWQKDKDYFIAFYDWRKTNDWTDPDPMAASPAKKYLKETIDKAKAANPQISKVNIVAHSLGGLVVRSYVESSNYRGDINKVAFIGSPNAGAIFAYYTWEGGEIPPNFDPLSKAALNFFMKWLSNNFKEDSYTMIHNRMKGIKDLMPINYDYLLKDNNPVNWTGMQEVNNFLKNTSSPQNTANIFSQKGVSLLNIVGLNQNTWEKLNVEAFVHNYLWKDGKPKGTAGSSDGDNTVLFSSSLLPGAQQYNLSGKHGNLPNAATQTVFNYLNINNYQPSSLAAAPDEIMVAWVASPVTLSVKDSQGHEVGQFLTDPEGEMKWVFVENPQGDYKINLVGTGSGDYHLGVDYYTDSKTESVQSQGTAIIGAQLNYDLHLDPQNNQIVQFQPEDQIPPTTTVQTQGTQGQNSWHWSDVAVSLFSSDNQGGTGLDKIEYSFNNNSWQKYNTPFTIQTEGITTVYYRSQDLVGNLEETKKAEIKIDKTAPEASLAFNPQTQKIEVQGQDNQSGVGQIIDNKGIIVINDNAGHTVKIVVKEKEKPRPDKISVESISYDGGPEIKPEENRLKVEFSWNKKDNNLRELEQEATIRENIKIKTHYDQKKNQTTIKTEENEDEKQKIIKEGLVLLKLITIKGALKIIY